MRRALNPLGPEGRLEQQFTKASWEHLQRAALAAMMLEMDQRDAAEVRIEIFRRMTPAQKLRAATRLYWSARQLKAAALRQAHPDWSSDRVEREARDAFLFHRS
jgi:hypothetical protein